MKDPAAGLLAAVFIGIVPGYISRSVAGSYDNEAIAIFLLMFTFYLWIRALKEGSVLYGTSAAVFYFYMVAAWGKPVPKFLGSPLKQLKGGYVFITNMIPLHALVLVLMGRFSNRLYVSYSSWYAVGTLASMQVPFVRFQPVSTSEHMAALGMCTAHSPDLFSEILPSGVFGLLQLVAFTDLVRSHVPERQFKKLFSWALVAVGLLGFGGFIGLAITGKIAPWTGRFYSLWDHEYAKKCANSMISLQLFLTIFSYV